MDLCRDLGHRMEVHEEKLGEDSRLVVMLQAQMAQAAEARIEMVPWLVSEETAEAALE